MQDLDPSAGSGITPGPPAPLTPGDEALIHALQLAPRASWSRIGEVLGVDPVTVARRWERLRSSGRAWITAYPGRRLQQGIEVTVVEIDCRSGEVEAVADALAAMPQIVTVEHMAGGRDLLVTLFTADLGALSRLLLDRISRMPGVVATRAQLATRVYGDGSRWRLRALSEAQQRSLSDLAPPRPARRPAGTAPEPPPELDAASRSLLPATSADGRRSVAQLAQVTGLSPTTVRRRLTRLIEEHDLMLRCEVARELTDWPVSATLWAQVPPAQLESAARGLLTLAEVRLCACVTGPNNLLFTVWLRSVADVQRLEAQLAERLPFLTLVDRAIALRQTKLMGHLVGPGGRATGVVPVDLWAETSGQGTARAGS
ncbi:Lrp/AsnC family transcriptional regulator [Streptomyces sp. B-S-A8]|uniref:Lrp/AsnC family transcriptional regulator n=1 Tax=Streptomyces solicavernae TaxID=3043614 RepID=A0ABT6RY19_9ACTN|nr:Lrp/AsnC family transcriptional regulator [Streptomyces sp. B-S-A8]MDI3389328.1 Lrp/AsnC family transcriptional regulator [Streptomyces sp. B-S-A8]